MQLKAIRKAGFAALLSGAFSACAAAPAAALGPPVRYYDDIKPVLAVHCYKCHDGEKPKGGLRLDTRTNALAGGKSGDAAIVPGASARSELVRRISLREGDEIMPPKGARLTETEVTRIQQWIDEGAKWP